MSDNEDAAQPLSAGDVVERRVVVGVDGSDASHNAMTVALAEANARGAILDVVHAWSIPAIVYYAPLSGGAMAATDLSGQSSIDEATAILSRALEDVPEGSTVSIRSSIVEGQPGQVLVEKAAGAELLVVGRGGRGHLVSLLLGSTSRDCVEHAGCPVLVVPSRTPPLTGSSDAEQPPVEFTNSAEPKHGEHREHGEPGAIPQRELVIEEIAVAECLELLGRSSFGRLAVVDEDLQPLIVPVNYTLTPDGVVIRTDAGSKLDHGKQRLVALEIDDINPSSHEGWSVLVRGHGFEVTDTLDDRSARLQAAGVDSWAPGAKARRLLVETSHVTGRRLHFASTSPPSDIPQHSR